MQRVLFATVLSLLIATALSAETRKWTSKDGRFSTEAEMVDHDDASVTLKNDSGATVKVPLERLSEADRRYLLALKKKLATAKESKEDKGPKDGKADKGDKDKKDLAVSYANDVRPFLTQYCAECHQQGKATAGYDVTNYATMTKRGKYGALVVPGKPDISRVCEVMEGMSKSMPPSGKPQPTAEEIAKIVAWVKAGAVDDSSQPAAAGKTRASGSRKVPATNTVRVRPKRTGVLSRRSIPDRLCLPACRCRFAASDYRWICRRTCCTNFSNVAKSFPALPMSSPIRPACAANRAKRIRRWGYAKAINTAPQIATLKAT